MTFESLSPMWMDAARELCNHLWQSTLFAGMVALLALLLRKNRARSEGEDDRDSEPDEPIRCTDTRTRVAMA